MRKVTELQWAADSPQWTFALTYPKPREVCHPLLPTVLQLFLLSSSWRKFTRYHKVKSCLPSREFPLGSPISYLSCDCDKVSDQRKAGKKGLFSCTVDGGKEDIARRAALAEVGGVRWLAAERPPSGSREKDGNVFTFSCFHSLRNTMS